MQFYLGFGLGLLTGIALGFFLGTLLSLVPRQELDQETYGPAPSARPAAADGYHPGSLSDPRD